jgi:hypothetical protein
MFMCSLISREQIHQFAPNLACLFLETIFFFFEKVKTPEKPSSCRVLVRVVPVAQKLCMIEQQCQDQSLF